MAKYEGRCMRCKKQVAIKDPKPVQWSNGMWVASGICNEDNKTPVNRIIGKTKPTDI